MRPMRPMISAVLLAILPLAGVLFSMTAIAQTDTPYIYTPGVPLITTTPRAVEVVGCYPPLGLRAGEVIYIKSGTNLRNQPSISGALVWNTIYDNTDANGRVVDNPVAVPAVVEEGPVCDGRLNWWRVSGLGNPGWVAEGRPDERGYFIIRVNVPAATTCTPRYGFSIGQMAQVQYNVRVREAPSTLGLTRTVVPSGDRVLILGGPQCLDGFLWWYVRATVANVVYEGWMAEGQPSGNDYLLPEDLEDQSVCATPRSFSVGQQVRVTYRQGPPKSLRAAPGVDAPLLFSLVRNVPMIIEGGPICRDELNWWRVRVLASTPVVGWMAEGSPGVGYWIAPLN